MKTRRALCWIFTVSACTLPGLDHPGPPQIAFRQTRTRAWSVVTDCPNGYTCEPGGAPADGEQGGTCVSLPCQSNADCGPGLTCYQGGGGIGAGAQLVPANCPQAAEDGGTCSGCVPQWDAPCFTNADCGPGFTCPVDTSTLRAISCGNDQDGSAPPYATVTTVSCSEAPAPASTTCRAGSICSLFLWNRCEAEQTGPCSVDSDCPSTWTCGCRAGCGLLNFPGSAIDSGCTTACSPPNSDLVVEECAVGGTPLVP